MSISTLNENMDIVQSLVIPGIDTDMDIIQKLDDEPNDVGGLTAQELKAEFDKAGNIVKTYINETLLPSISDSVAEEEQRAQAEAQRQANELARQQAEEQRANETSGIVAQATAQAQLAQQSAGAAAQSASSAAQNAAKTSADADSAAQNAAKTSSDRQAIQSAIDNIPPGSVPVINNLTTGGTSAALSAEQGKLLGTLSNLTNPQQALANLGAGVRPNLLDNWYFVGGGSQQGGGQFPINQRGQKSYSESFNSIFDRWKCGRSGSVITLTPDYLALNNLGDLFQITQNVDQGETVTASILTTDGLFSGTVTIPIANSENIGINAYQGNGITIAVFGLADGNVQFSILTDSEKNLIAAKLELGPTQTLAYQDESGHWQLFETPNYVDELHRCQYYYEQSAWFAYYAAAYTETTINPGDSMQFKSTKRIDPTVTVNPNPLQSLTVYDTETGQVVQGCSLAIPSAWNAGMFCPNVQGSGFVPGRVYRVEVPDRAYLISAEL